MCRFQIQKMRLFFKYENVFISNTKNVSLSNTKNASFSNARMSFSNTKNVPLSNTKNMFVSNMKTFRFQKGKMWFVFSKTNVPFFNKRQAIFFA